MNQNYDLSEFLMTCEQTFARTIETERAVAVMSDPQFHDLFKGIVVELSNKQLPLDKLHTTIAKQPIKTNALLSLLRGQAQSSSGYCEVGFGEGATSLLGLVGMPNSKVYSFEGNEQAITVPVHDFVDSK